MIIREISFLGSFPDISKLSQYAMPEFAFIGRSNVGKSSLINMLCNRKDLAKTSSTPGKTQMINLFQINNQWILCDLPGYGYAKISKSARLKWKKMIRKYLTRRDSLNTVFVLIDLRLPPQPLDKEQILSLAQDGIPFCVVFTKADKLGPGQTEKSVALHQKWMEQEFDPLPNLFISSAEKQLGRDELLDYISFISGFDNLSSNNE